MQRIDIVSFFLICRARAFRDFDGVEIYFCHPPTRSNNVVYKIAFKFAEYRGRQHLNSRFA